MSEKPCPHRDDEACDICQRLRTAEEWLSAISKCVDIDADLTKLTEEEVRERLDTIQFILGG